MSTTTQFTTADELFRMPDNAYRYELVEGELRKMSPAGAEHGVLSVEIAARLAEHIRQKKLGVVLSAETGFRIGRNPDTVLAPDAAFIRIERVAILGIPKEFFPEAPALVVEVVSPNDTAEEVDDKMRRWFAAGVELGWVIYPRGRTITVYRGLEDIRILTTNDELDGVPVLPDFRCRVNSLFAALDD